MKTPGNIDKVIEQLNAIKKIIADSGASVGEKDNATSLLQKLMKLYNIADEDIVDTDSKRELVLEKFDFNNRHEYLLLFQIVYQQIEKPHAYFLEVNPDTKRKSKKCVWIYLPPDKVSCIRMLYSTYRKSLDDEFERVTLAFIMKNKIYPKTINAEASEEVKNKVKEVLSLMNEIKVVELPEASSPKLSLDIG